MGITHYKENSSVRLLCEIVCPNTHDIAKYENYNSSNVISSIPKTWLLVINKIADTQLLNCMIMIIMATDSDNNIVVISRKGKQSYYEDRTNKLQSLQSSKLHVIYAMGTIEEDMGCIW